MVVGQLAFSSMAFIDTVLMGQLGVETLAGGGLGAVVYQFFYIVGIGVLVATANLIAFAKGQGDEEEVQRALLSGVVIVGLLFTSFASLIWQMKPILLFFGQETAVVEISEAYLDVVVWALLPALAFILLRSLVLGLGDPSAILPISVSAALLNYPLSYTLMNGLYGLPELGIQGVALGTCIVSWGMVLGLAWMSYRKAAFRIYPFWSRWHLFSWQQLDATLRLGIPIAIAHAMEIGMFSAAALLIGSVGIEALAAHQVALQCATIAFMIPLGISQAVSVKVGEFYGAKRHTEIRRAVRYSLAIGTASALLAGSLFWLLPEWLVAIFIDQESAADMDSILPLAISILFVAAVFQLVDSWQVVLMGVLRGFKLGASPTIVAVISYWLIGFPISYYLLGLYGAVGVWTGMGIGLGSSALLLAILYQTTIKERDERLSSVA